MKPFLLSLLVLSSLGMAALPPDAQKLLDTLPEKKITLKLVIGGAIKSSESFETVKSDAISIEAPLFQAMGPLGWKATAEIGFQDDQTEPLNVFGTTRTQAEKYSLGLSKAFSTGTLFSLDLVHGYQDLTSPSFSISPVFYTTGTLSISQRLWRDSFGSGTRSGLEAAEQQTKANEFQFEANVEDWMVDLIDTYYSAWLAQAKAKVAVESLKRRTRLLKVTNLKAKRGTAETPDVLQIKSAHLGSQVQKDQAHETVWAEWRALVTTLKLPDKWLEIDPIEIPMSLDSPVESALKACKELTPVATAQTQAADHSAKAAQANFDHEADKLRPELDFQFQFWGNGVDGARGPSLDEAGRIDNPAWNAGLKLTVPLGNDAQKAAVATAAANKMKAEAGAIIAKDLLKVRWLNGCSSLKSASKSHKRLEQAWKNQIRRANLENRRFRIGRSQTIQVIQAEDDASNAQNMFHDAEVNLRKAAWQIRRMSGQFKQYLKSIGVNQVAPTS